MKSIRTLVVDDEPLARSRIVNLLNKVEGILVIGECKNGREAIKQITNYRPDLVFLDIQMPDLNGFDVLAKLPYEELPFIIFVTAYDQYALKAFDVHAVDYLLKPYDDDRFHTALEHAQSQILLKENAVLHHKMQRLLDDFRQQQHPGLTLEVKHKGKSQLINIYDIYHIESHGNYVWLHLESLSYLHRQTLQAITEQVDHATFLRIHRSILVNANYIERIKYSGNNQYTFFLKNKKELHSGRSYRQEIQEFIDNSSLKIS